MAQRIDWAIEQSGETISVLAERAGCTHASLSQWRHGRTSNIRSDLLLKFADATGIDFRWLITGQGPVRARGPLGPDVGAVEDAMVVVAREQPATYQAIKRMILAAAESV